jgi:RNA-directed DNA polymerase
VLRGLAKNWRAHYAPFEQAKKAKPHSNQAKPSKLRHIDNPCKELKAIQAKILGRLLLPVTLPDFLFGAVRNRCVRAHATAHLGAATVVKMDIKSYYPSVTTRHVFNVWKHVLKCSTPVAELLTQLTTCDWHLPQGAPTSPALANIFLSSIYGPVLQACKEKEVVVTVWVDDLTFSGKDARDVMEIVRKTLAVNGLKDSRAKRKILDAKTPKVVTGVRLGSNKIRACKFKLREIRAGIHNVKVGKTTPRGRSKDIESLQGKIVYVRSLCPADALSLEAQLKIALGQQRI